MLIPLVTKIRIALQICLSEDLLAASSKLVVRMVSNGESSLTPLAQDTLDALAKELPEEGKLTYQQAYAILNEQEDLERPAAEDIIEWLYMRGHIYEVEGKIRITDFSTTE